MEYLGRYGLISLDEAHVCNPKLSQVEGYLKINQPLHEFFQNPEQEPSKGYLVTRLGSRIDISGKRFENPKIVVTKGAGEIKENMLIGFSDSALQPIKQILSYC